MLCELLDNYILCYFEIIIFHITFVSNPKPFPHQNPFLQAEGCDIQFAKVEFGGEKVDGGFPTIKTIISVWLYIVMWTYFKRYCTLVKKRPKNC